MYKLEWIFFMYLCIHGKCNPWDYVTMERDVRLFKVWRVFCITSPLVLHEQDTSYLLQLKSKSYGFQETAKFSFMTSIGNCFQGNCKHSTIIKWRATWPNFSSYPCSLPTATEVPVTVVTNKGHKRKRQVSESETDEVPISTATDKSCKRRKQNPEIQDSPGPFELMMNYFDKRF